MDSNPRIRLLTSILAVLGGVACPAAATGQWQRHTIDRSSQGADGVRLLDVNHDGRLDIATGWEEGGQIRIYLNPGPEKSRLTWPAATVGMVASPEDAVFVDLDNDGAVDVVSSCEGRTKTMFVHWAPRASVYLAASAWKTETLACTAQQQAWMYCLPMEMDGRNGIDLVVGSKGANASVGWLESPADPRDVAAWKYHRLCDAGWIMSLERSDLDHDGDDDLLVSDRKGAGRGVFWLENPGSASAFETWPRHPLGGKDREVMFLYQADLDQDGQNEVLSAVKDRDFLVLRRSPAGWSASEIPIPAGCGTGKSIAAADIDLDGTVDVVFSCENAAGEKSGVRWLTRQGERWIDHEISGPVGVKYDQIRLVDLDADGDVDVLTCEERANLGVIWYENPTRSRAP